MSSEENNSKNNSSVDKRQASRSFGKPYECHFPWPEDCIVQCGGHGLVFTSGSLSEVLEDKDKAGEAVAAVLGATQPKNSYRTAFFEAFPSNPICFIRGEGASVEEAEEKAWGKLARIQACPGHQFDRRGREDGYAYCTLCPYSSTVLEPTTSCKSCGKPAHHGQDADGAWYCEPDYHLLDYDRHLAKKDVGSLSSQEFIRYCFVHRRTTLAIFRMAGIPFASDLHKDLSYVLIKAEVWDDELEREKTAVLGRRNHDNGVPLPPDAQIEASYRAAFPRILEWLLRQNIEEKLVDAVRQVAAALAGEKTAGAP